MPDAPATPMLAPTAFATFPAFAAALPTAVSPTRAAIAAAIRRDERTAVRALLTQWQAGDDERRQAQELARRLIAPLRAKPGGSSGIDALMHEFSLSSAEGVALMCLAEALLRIPDRATADRLIADKIAHGDWRAHVGHSPSLFVNAAAWSLLLTGRWLDAMQTPSLETTLTHALSRGGAPLIRKAMDHAMRLLGERFVAGRDIGEALHRAQRREEHGYRHSYDMLGEAALTAADADIYLRSYQDALHAIGRNIERNGHAHDVETGPGISVKLSALHPRYAHAQRERVMHELLPRLKALLLLAKDHGIGINIDAEEADRLELSLDLLDALACDTDLAGFNGLGFVVQAYQKRAPFVIDHLIDVARRNNRRLMIRLVKGAYWDTEIKRAQIDGLPDYPVYTRKAYTDLGYLVCAQRLLKAADAVYPQFATHNALTLAAVHARAKTLGVTRYEFQCLHGMGEALYDQIAGEGLGVPCRIYAPVGSHETLLPYLVRRLLENGANSSFVNQLVDEDITEQQLLADPAETAASLAGEPHPMIPLPADLYAPRRNAPGIDIADDGDLAALADTLRPFAAMQWQAAPAIPTTLVPTFIRNPADHGDIVGTVCNTDEPALDAMLAAAASSAWHTTSSITRRQILLNAADLYEHHRAELLALLIREAGRTLPNAIGEWREAVDFLRYYAAALDSIIDSIVVNINDGNALPLGTVACISPWNFPLSIFTGQIAAALAAGNTVLAKPAEQTPLIAGRIVQLLHEAGVPRDALHFVPGRGETTGARLVADPRVDGVLFTGSTDAARTIHRTLVERMAQEKRELALIAETGGQNAMIVDSSALCEQVVRDALASAFDSAGQRCSALRVLCLQEEIADRTLAMLDGAMHELRIGRPDALDTDVGPVIDAEAQHRLHEYIAHARDAGRLLAQLPLPANAEAGTFVAPAIIHIDRIADIPHEVFGPVLHVLRYRREALPQTIDALNATGYGLTLGIHTRLDETARFITEHAHVGNVYVNRNMIGAVVGSQPFGGTGLSGTGPKAGGPLYLPRLQRGKLPCLSPSLPSPTTAASSKTVERIAWQAMRQWHIRDGQDCDFTSRCDRYDAASLYSRSLSLPGPTGESNRLNFIARGTVCCIADDTAALLNQLAAVLASGNHAVIDTAAAALLPPDFPETVHAAIRIVPEYRDCRNASLLLVDASCMHKLPACIAADGFIATVLQTTAEDIPLWRLAGEQAVCTNTAAAGGNAALIALTS